MAALLEVHKDSAAAALRANGRRVQQIRAIQEGANHYVFDVIFDDDEGSCAAICKFPKIRLTEQGITAENRDTLFDGPLSLERESAVFQIVREKAFLPAPKVYAIESSALGNYILLEKMPGLSHKAFLKRRNYTLDAFLQSLCFLAEDFAKLHRALHFDRYGDFISPGRIEPGNRNFADRFLAVTRMRLQKARRKAMLGEKEAQGIDNFFTRKFEEYRPRLGIEAAPATLVFTDMHGENFFVDENGKPSGYFDLESAQAAPAALEFYGLYFFLFNFFDEITFHKAEAAFFGAYEKAGGPWPPRNREDHDCIDLLAASRLLEISQSYWGYTDGLRDTWGERIFQLLQNYIQTGNLDYPALGRIWRERDRQPSQPG